MTYKYLLATWCKSMAHDIVISIGEVQRQQASPTPPRKRSHAVNDTNNNNTNTNDKRAPTP